MEKTIEKADKKLSVLLNVLASRDADRLQRKKARLKAYSHHVLNTVYLMDFITTDEYFDYVLRINTFGFLLIPSNDPNLFLFRAIARGL